MYISNKNFEHFTFFGFQGFHARGLIMSLMAGQGLKIMSDSLNATIIEETLTIACELKRGRGESKSYEFELTRQGEAKVYVFENGERTYVNIDTKKMNRNAFCDAIENLK